MATATATKTAKKPKQHKCLRCGYTWTPRIPTRPKKCVQCQSRDWDGKLKKILADAKSGA